MKVLDSPVTPPAFNTMGKKKHKLRKLNDTGYTDGSSEDISMAGTGCAGRGCVHIQKAVSLQTVRKSIRQTTVGQCSDCLPDNQPRGSEDTDIDVEITVWLCLQCGHQGCDRNSASKHALKHYQTPRSVSHAVVVNTTSWLVWCYECDDEVFSESNRKLAECVDYVKRHSSPSGLADVAVAGGQHTSPVNTPDVNTSLTPPLARAKPAVTNSLNSALPRVKGLSNLGNTCFFNAVLQNLSQTHELDAFLIEHIKSGSNLRLVVPPDGPEASESEDDDEEEKVKDANDHCLPMGPIDVTVQEAGSLTQSLSSFLKDMAIVSKNSTVSPSLLFGQICKKTPRFKGFQQQDSHELLRHLLDGMKSEEIKRCQRAILNHFNLPDNVNPKKVEDDMKAKIREYGRVVKSLTFVDSVFGGHLISTVVCEECQAASQIYEPFLDLSLPLNEEKPGRPNAPSGGKKERDHLMTEKNPDPPPVNRGVDGFATNSNKPSKYQLKKEKKMARSKKRRSRPKPSVPGASTNQTAENGDDVTGEATNDDADAADGAEPNDRPLSESTPRKKDGDLESNSDSDVEDNVESDTSRTVTTPQVDSSTGCHGDDEDELSMMSSDSSQPEIVDHLMNPENPDSESEKVTCLESKLHALSLEDSTEVNTEVNGDVSSEHSTPKHQEKVTKRELVLKSMSTLASRYHPLAHECSVMSCLNQFTSAELLTGNNKFICKQCTKTKWKASGKQGKRETVYTNASKQLLICDPPAVLTLHLKRFQQVGYSLRKVNRHVEFPLVLDLAPYCSALSKRVEAGSGSCVKYALYGAVEHSGRLSGGHYTAYVRVRHNAGRSRQFWRQTPFNGLLTNEIPAETSNSDSATKEDRERPAFIPGRWYYISDTHVKESSEHEVLKCQAYILFYERIV